MLKNEKAPEEVKRTPLAGTVVWGFALVVFIVYVVGYIWQYYHRPEIPETLVVMGTTTSPIVSEGVIIRDETVYRAETAGVAVFAVADLSKVRKGEVVCSVENAEKVEDLKREINDLSENIIGIQNQRGELSVFAQDIAKANESIKKIIDSKIFGAQLPSSGDMRAVYTFCDKVRQNIQYRNSILLSESKGDIRSYTARKDMLTNLLANARLSVSARESGIVSSNVDGYEESFTFENMEKLSKEATLVMIEEKLRTVGSVEIGEPIFKVIKSNEWYLAAYVTAELTQGWRENTLVTIEVERDGAFEPLEMRVKSLERVGNGEERFILLQCTKYVLDFLTLRRVNFLIDQGVTQGLKIPSAAIADKTFLKIPKSCVTDNEGRKAVTKRTPKGAKSVFITIKREDDEFYYVLADYNDLYLGDQIEETNGLGIPYTLSEIVNVRGVYALNTGSAVFKEIFLDENYIRSDEYVLLNPATNTGLKIHDRIIADIKYAGQERLVY